MFSKHKIRKANPAPVAIVLASKATARFPFAKFSPIIPEPTTIASKNAVPINSEKNFFGKFTVFDEKIKLNMNYTLYLF